MSENLILLDSTTDYLDKIVGEVNKCDGMFDKMLIIKAACMGKIITAKESQNVIDKIILRAFAL